MHFEVPKSHSFKAFASEYVMIVVSILTALALENAVHSYHQSHKAHEAARNLDAEIAVNIAEVRSALAHNDNQVKRLKHLREVLLADIKAGADDKTAIAHVMHEAGERFTMSILTPSLQREAWDVAVANQALSYMTQERLQRYAKLYANMRDTESALKGAGGSFMDRPQLSNAMSNLEMNDITSRELYRVLAQLGFLHESNGHNMRLLEKMLVEGPQGGH